MTQGIDVDATATEGPLRGAPLMANIAGAEDAVYLLHPSAYDTYPFALRFTPRTKGGLPKMVAPRYKESFGPNLRCQRCGINTGQLWAGGTRACDFFLRAIHF